ncbi:MAG: cation:proton antiporter regulatory subunit [Halanaeroarchaeum sp.]
MTVYETDVPGVGHKFELELDGAERLVVLIHHDGKREIYHRPDAESDSKKLFTLTGDQANKLGSILEGAYFEPVEMDETQVPLGESIIEWIDVEEGSPLVGKSLREADIRGRTGASIIAIQRDDTTIDNPQSAAVVQREDILVALGTRDELRALDDLVRGTNSNDEPA